MTSVNSFVLVRTKIRGYLFAGVLICSPEQYLNILRREAFDRLEKNDPKKTLVKKG